MTYEEQLLTFEWRAKRFEIIERDFGMCQKCMSTQNLQVHHKYYVKGRMAWDYPNIALITLCSNCHKLEHESGKIGNASPLEFALDKLHRSAGGLIDYFKSKK